MTKTEEKLASLCVDEIKKYTVLLVEQRDDLMSALEKARFYVAEYAKRSDMADETLLNIDRAIAAARGEA